MESTTLISSKPFPKSFVLLFLFLVFQAACGGGSGGTQLSTSPPPPPSGPTSGSEFLYQLSFATGIQVSELDTTTGALGSPIQAIPFNDFENQGVPAVVTPSGKFLYEERFLPKSALRVAVLRHSDQRDLGVSDYGSGWFADKFACDARSSEQHRPWIHSQRAGHGSPRQVPFRFCVQRPGLPIHLDLRHRSDNRKPHQHFNSLDFRCYLII